MTLEEKIMLEHGLTNADFEPHKDGEPTQLDRIEAQTMWTALMTDTLLEE